MAIERAASSTSLSSRTVIARQQSLFHADQKINSRTFFYSRNFSDVLRCIVNSLKIAKAASDSSSSSSGFLLFSWASLLSAREGWRRIIDVECFHARSKADVGERQLLLQYRRFPLQKRLRLRSRWLIILTDVGRSISVTVLVVPVAKWWARKERRGSWPRQEEEAARVSASQPDTDWQRDFIRRHDGDFILSTRLVPLITITVISSKKNYSRWKSS